MARPRQPLEIKRRIPRQARAAETLAAILEGATQILEKGGLGAFTTNAVAERSGVSVGTLYQYFADKNAVLRALAEREMQVVVEQVARALEAEDEPTVESRVRTIVRALVGAFRGRQRARKAVLQAILAQGGGVEMIAPVAAFLGRQASRLQGLYGREQLFVLTRALMGTIRAAVLEEQPFLTGRTFEDELVRMTLAYLASVGGE